MAFVPAFVAAVLAASSSAAPSEQTTARLKSIADQETRSVRSQEVGRLRARTQLQTRKPAAVSQAASDAAACRATPRIQEVGPDVVMPDDSLTITGCGFGGSRGMVLLSDGGQQLAVTAWTDNAVEATMPHLTGFADPKTVTVRIVTVDATRTAPSRPVTLRPLLDLYELAPTSVALEGCHKDFQWGTVFHAFGALVTATCRDHYGVDRIRFNVALRNGWTFHSVILTKLCGPTFSAPCGGENDATPVTDVYRVGRPELPDLVVNWKKDVAYYPAIRLMGPAGTPPR